MSARRRGACREHAPGALAGTGRADIDADAGDPRRTQGFAPNYPMIGDTDFNVSKLYGMLPAAVSGDPSDSTAWPIGWKERAMTLPLRTAKKQKLREG